MKRKFDLFWYNNWKNETINNTWKWDIVYSDYKEKMRLDVENGIVDATTL